MPRRPRADNTNRVHYVAGTVARWICAERVDGEPGFGGYWRGLLSGIEAATLEALAQFEPTYASKQGAGRALLRKRRREAKAEDAGYAGRAAGRRPCEMLISCELYQRVRVEAERRETTVDELVDRTLTRWLDAQTELDQVGRDPFGRELHAYRTKEDSKP
jgi:hypothetical protein